MYLGRLLTTGCHPGTTRECTGLYEVVPRNYKVVPRHPAQETTQGSLHENPTKRVPTTTRLQPRLQQRGGKPTKNPFELRFKEGELPRRPFSQLASKFRPSYHRQLRKKSLASPRNSPPPRNTPSPLKTKIQ